MAGIANQPAPKPQSLPKPVPTTEPSPDMFAPPSPDEMAMFAAPTPEELGQTAPSAEPQFADTTAGQIVGTAAEYLPAVGGLIGGIAGGIAGSAAGGVGAYPGAIGGSALGGAAGAAYRDLIETQILGKKQRPAEEVATDIVKSGAMEGASQAIGGAIMKGLGVVGSKVLQYGDDALKAVKGAVTQAKNAVEEPVTKMIFEKATPLTPRESGDAVKNLIVNNIQGKYAPFVKAYSELDEIGAALPLKDESRRGLTQKIREWIATDLGGDDARIVRKFVDDLDAADNGMKLRNVISQIGDARNSAYMNGASQQARTLKMLQDRANEFLEGETTKMASRIARGKGSEVEIGFLNKILQTKGIQEPNPTKYAQQLANDYLKSLGKVKKDYAGFRSFLEDVAEQAKVPVSKRGPVSFIDDIKSVPSEKLIEKMFDPKNVKALEQMQKETPEVFAEVAKARVKNLLEKSSPTGELDLKAFQKTVNKLPPDTRKLLFSPEDLAAINKTAVNAKLQSLSSLEKKLDSKMMGYLQEISTIVGEKTPQAVKVPLRQAVGKPIAKTAEQLLPRVVGTEGE